MRTLCAVALLFSVTLPAIAEELHAVDPKTVIDTAIPSMSRCVSSTLMLLNSQPAQSRCSMNSSPAIWAARSASRSVANALNSDGIQ
jgi:hypothetical protein